VRTGGSVIDRFKLGAWSQVGVSQGLRDHERVARVIKDKQRATSRASHSLTLIVRDTRREARRVVLESPVRFAAVFRIRSLGVLGPPKRRLPVNRARIPRAVLATP